MLRDAGVVRIFQRPQCVVELMPAGAAGPETTNRVMGECSALFGDCEGIRESRT